MTKHYTVTAYSGELVFEARYLSKAEAYALIRTWASYYNLMCSEYSFS